MPIHDWAPVNAGIFHHFHQDWIVELARTLNRGGLPEGYYALAEQVAAGPIPDVVTLQRSPIKASGADGTAAGLAVTESPPKARFVHAAEREQYAARASRIAIHHPLGEVVSVVEIVSPGNKGSRHALRSFVDKAVSFLDQGIHLLVVDLLPPTSRDPQGIHKAIWDEIHEEPFELPADKSLTVVSYDAGWIKTAYVEPLAVGDPLPEAPLFLAPGRYVPVPLEFTYQATWSNCPAPLRDLVQPHFGDS
jgi:hypothetical protein